MEVNKLFQYSSSRAHKARIGVSLAPWILSLDVGTVLLIVAGLAALGFESYLGWASIGLAAIPAMISRWYKDHLHNLPIVAGGERIDDLLDADILGHIPAQPTPKQLLAAIRGSHSGQFFAARMGIGPGFIEQLIDDSRDNMNEIWQAALNLKTKSGSHTLHGGTLMAALALQLPQHSTLLARLQLDDSDLVAGIRWYDRLRSVIDRHSQKVGHPGGIGRDWAFGWIPNLSRFGTNISDGAGSAVELEAHKSELDQLIKTLGGEGKHNAALVGKSGSGKTELVYALAGRLMLPTKDLPAELHYQQVFLLDAASLISAAGSRGKLESLVNQLLGEAYAAKNIIVCLDNAQLFFEEGVGSVDLTNVLLPILDGGRLPMILTMDEQRYLQIDKRTPELANSLNRITVQPSSAEETMAIMQDQLIMIEYQYKTLYMYQALKEAYQLAERYVQDLVMPGRALKLLESASNYAQEKIVGTAEVRAAIEKTMNVKVGMANDADERDTLLNLEKLIHERMIGQARAVDAVSDALRRARAGVRNQNRPIGTFLFLGPTGVGKTELAKSLAAVYFGGEDRLIRLDMNEFVAAEDVSRLISDGASDPNSLTAQVAKQPFSVILLDEIEKAHTSVLATLLQMLDEGIMRDINNNEVSFRDAIVIATSNAGAERINEYISRGYKLEQFEDQFVNELISSRIFHPEFLNRFDEIVVFGTLSKSELLQVVDLILKGVNKTLENQKVSVVVSPEAREYLVEAGYDPRLGARPMRRVIQKAVENIVAKEVLSGNTQAGDTVQIDLEQVKAILDKSRLADAIMAGEDAAK